MEEIRKSLVKKCHKLNEGSSVVVTDEEVHYMVLEFLRTHTRKQIKEEQIDYETKQS